MRTILSLQVAVLLLSCLQIGVHAVKNNVASPETRRFHRRYQHLYYGQPDSHRDFPHLVRVRWNSPDTPTTCAGALVTASWAIASAACFKEAATRMRAANQELTWKNPVDCTMTGYVQRVDVEEIRIHDGYLREDPKSDISIAVLKGKTPFNLNKNLKVARFSESLPSHRPVGVFACIVAGYGQWNGTERRHPRTRMISWYHATAGGAAHCQRLENELLNVSLATAGKLLQTPTYDDRLCCARADDLPTEWGMISKCSIDGDMGGVLSCSQHVVGVTAWMTYNVCAPNKPQGATVYTSVGHPSVYNWLKSVVPDMPKLHLAPKADNKLWRSSVDKKVFSSVAGRRCSTNTRCYVGITGATFAVILLLW